MKTIKAYLRDKGDDAVVAQSLGVTTRAVRSWRLGERFPARDQMKAIVVLARADRIRISLDRSVMEE